jgi:hypothetical protein
LQFCRRPPAPHTIRLQGVCTSAAAAAALLSHHASTVALTVFHQVQNAVRANTFKHYEAGTPHSRSIRALSQPHHALNLTPPPPLPSLSAIAAMSPPSPRSLHPLPPSLSRAHIMFNSAVTQPPLEHRFPRTGVSDGSLCGRGAAPAPPPTGAHQAAEDAFSCRDMYREAWEGERGGAMQWGLHADDASDGDQDGGGRAGESTLPLLTHLGGKQAGGADTRDAATPDGHAVGEGSSCRAPGSASSIGSSHRWCW